MSFLRFNLGTLALIAGFRKLAKALPKSMEGPSGTLRDPGRDLGDEGVVLALAGVETLLDVPPEWPGQAVDRWNR